MLVMSLLLQPEDIEAPLEGGVSIWRFKQQQAELACHLSSDTPAHCVLTTHGMIAAAGQSPLYVVCSVSSRPCQALQVFGLTAMMLHASTASSDMSGVTSVLTESAHQGWTSSCH